MSEAVHRPSVTVVIPCFNQARFLPAAVASVRDQRYADLQCIIVNDGSTDDTAAVATQLGVRALEQPNSGVAAARNAGLAAATGDFVVFLDADDELVSGAVACAAQVLSADAPAAAVVGRCQLMEVDGSPRAAVYSVVDPDNLYAAWLSHNFVWTPGAAMFKRDALRNIGGFPPDLGPAADYAVYLRLARSGRVRLVTRDLVRYRQHEASMSRDPVLMLRATLAVLRRESREAPASWRRPIARGRRRWCEWYGEQIVSQLRADWRAGHRGRVQARAALTLVRYSPQVALRHAARKTSRLLTSAWRRQASEVAP